MSGDLTFNKYAAAILATALGFMLIKEVSHSAMHTEYPEKPAYGADLVVAEPEDGPVIELPFPQETWIASMDAARGAKVFKKCTSCHNADEGGKNGTGPNLWNIVGSSAAANGSFAYSGAMTNSGVNWGYEELDAFLKKPTNFMSGTKMNFVGLKKEGDRAAVIELLRQAAPSPMAQPVAAAVPASDMVEEMVAGGEPETPEVIVDGMKEELGEVLETAEDTMNDVKEEAESLLDKAKEVVEEVAEDATGDDH